MEKIDKLVMVVDDEPTICRILARILTEAGYNAITAYDGTTALALFEKHRPDVILLDLIMPGMNGREVCNRIRQISTTTRIIYLTAKVIPAASSEFKEYRRESDAFITKPAGSKQILSTVSRVLRSDK